MNDHAPDPDYEFLIKLNHWSKKEASLILSGLDPANYRQNRFNAKEITPDLEDAYKLYTLFRKNLDIYNDHPTHYLKECFRIAWPVPENLISAVKALYVNPSSESENQEMQNPNEGIRERKNILKLVGILVKLYVTKCKTPRYLHAAIQLAACKELAFPSSCPF